MTNQIFTLTEAAADRVRTLLTKSEGATGLRISVKTRGCSGKAYELQYVQAPQPGDETVDQHGVQLFIDPMAVMYVIGTTMDYFDTGLESGFMFDNPNEKGRCGCGESFHV